MKFKEAIKKEVSKFEALKEKIVELAKNIDEQITESGKRTEEQTEIGEAILAYTFSFFAGVFLMVLLVSILFDPLSEREMTDTILLILLTVGGLVGIYCLKDWFMEYLRTHRFQKNKNEKKEENIPDNIKELGKLHNEGILSDEEFKQAKEKLLERL